MMDSKFQGSSFQYLATGGTYDSRTHGLNYIIFYMDIQGFWIGVEESSLQGRRVGVSGIRV
jgi:hypothetical protein